MTRTVNFLAIASGILLAFLMFTDVFTPQPAETQYAAKPTPRETAVKSTLTLIFTPSEGQAFRHEGMTYGSCSGTAVSDRVILTASHCVMGSLAPLPGFIVNGSDRASMHEALDLDFGQGKMSLTGAKVVHDGMDHMLIILPGPTFTTWAPVSLSVLLEGDPVWIIGNPLGLKRIHRRGVFAGSMEQAAMTPGEGQLSLGKGLAIALYDMRVSSGDSGAGLFSDRGVLHGVVSSSLEFSPPGMAGLQMAGAYAMRFSAESWSTAGIKLAR